jgi:chromosome segregation ATPase
MADRKTYAKTVAELQGRLELAVEELRRSFTPVQFADSFHQLEQRMGQFVALEAQLRQKDDVIAMRDDQIEILRQHLTNIQKHVLDVSGLFAQLPRSIEEVEIMMVENDEYRRKLGMDPQSQERVQQKLLELQAKRRAGEQVSASDLNQVAQANKTGAKLDKLQKAAADALATVAQTVGSPDAIVQAK